MLKGKRKRPCPFHKDIWGSRGIAPLINLSTRWMRVVNVMPLSLYPWERNMVPTELKAGWAPEFSLDVLEKRDISVPHSVIRSPIIHPVT
jgi:hypothetical protein